jgi:hypothetical protein
MTMNKTRTTNDQCQMINREKKQRPELLSTRREKLELYHVIVQCTDESQQRDLYERLKREGYLCRVAVL